MKFPKIHVIKKRTATLAKAFYQKVHEKLLKNDMMMDDSVNHDNVVGNETDDVDDEMTECHGLHQVSNVMSGPSSAINNANLLQIQVRCDFAKRDIKIVHMGVNKKRMATKKILNNYKSMLTLSADIKNIPFQYFICIHDTCIYFVTFYHIEPKAISEIEQIYKEYTAFCNLQFGKLKRNIILFLIILNIIIILI